MDTRHQHTDRLEGLADQAAVVYWETDAAGIVTRCEGGGLAGQDVGQRDVLGRSLFELYRDYPALLDCVTRALAGEPARVVTETFGIVHDRFLQPIRDASGAIKGIAGISIDISGQQRAREHARRVEEQYRSLVESSLQGILIHRNERILFANRAYAQLLGYHDPAELSGKSATETIAPHERARFMDYAARRSRGESLPDRYETDLIHRDGTIVPVIALVRVAEWQGEQAIQSTVIDIGDRKRAEQQFRDLIDGSLQGILIRRGYKPLFVNQVWAGLHGFASPEAALEFGTVEPFMSPASAEQLRTSDTELLRTRQPLHEIVSRIRPDGTAMLFQQSKRVVDWDGAPAIQVTVVDVTDRQRAEAEMRASQKLLQSVVDALPVHVFVKNLDSRYVMANRALADFYGMSQQEFLNSTILDLPVTPDLQSALRLDDLSVIQSRKPFIEPEKRITTRAGREMICHSTKLPLIDEHGAVTGVLGVGIDISQIKRAEAALRQNEQIYQQIHDAVIATDLDGRVILWSPGAERIYGYSRQEMLGRTLGILWPEGEDGESKQESLYRSLHAAGHLQVVAQRRRKSGEAFHASISLSFLKDAHGKPDGIIGTSYDVSKMIRVETDLRQSEEQYRALVEDSPQGILIYGSERIEFANAASARILGYHNVEALLALDSIDAVVTPEDRKRMREQRLRRLAGAQVPEQYDAILVRLDGTRVHVLSSSRVIRWRGKPAIQTTMLDITERKLAEDALREKEWFLARAQQAGNIGTWYRPMGSSLIQWSEETYRISGVDRRSFVPSLDANLQLIHPDDRAAFLENRRQVNNSGETFRDEYRIVRPDGQMRYVRMVGERLGDAAGKPIGVIGIIQDVTELKIAEAQALQAQKIDAVGRLTAGIAHDFNNLLTVLRGNLELALQQVDSNEALRRLLDAVLAAADRGAGLIQQLSGLTRQQPLHPETVDVAQALTEMASLLDRTLGSQIRIVTSFPESGWCTRMDRAQFDNAILNLAINARDAMPTGGRLTISAANMAADPKDVPAGIECASGEFIVVSLTDTGTGIPPALHEKIFEPFFTTKPMGKGTGLGLSMVSNFVRQSGGWIAVESDVGEGTTVRLYFPRVRHAPPTAKHASSNRAAVQPPASGATVLIVEDRAEVRSLAEQIFEVLGFRAISAANGPAALEILKDRPDVALLFTDLMLPHGMNGAEVAKQALRQNPHLAVLITSGFAEDTADITGLVDRGAIFVEKPYRIAEIRARLEQLNLIPPP